MRYFFFFLLLANMTIQAQEAPEKKTITWGYEGKIKENSYIKKIIAANNGGWVAIRKKKSKKQNRSR